MLYNTIDLRGVSGVTGAIIYCGGSLKISPESPGSGDITHSGSQV